MKANIVNSRKNESGNVLFLILIAVALFAALSYAVSQSSRSGSGDSQREKTLIGSSQVTQYPSAVRTSVLRMTLAGVAPEDIYFDPPSLFCPGAPGCTITVGGTDDEERRAVFHPAGGGAPYQLAQPEMMMSGTVTQGEWVFSDLFRVARMGTSPTAPATSGNEMIGFLPNLTLSLCRRLNTEFGIVFTTAQDGDGDGVPRGAAATFLVPDIATHTMDYTNRPGFNTAFVATNEIGGPFTGQAFGCIDSNDGNATSPVIYYHVLMER